MASLPSPQICNLVRIERILELHVDLRTGQDATCVVFPSECTDSLGRGGGEERAGQPERALVQLVAALRRVPEKRSAHLAVAVGEVPSDLQPPRVVDAAGDEGGSPRARDVREHAASPTLSPPPGQASQW